MSQPARAPAVRQPRRRRRLLVGLAAVPLLAYLVVLVVRRVQIAERDRGQVTAEAALRRLGAKITRWGDNPILEPFTRRMVEVNLVDAGVEVGDEDLAALDGIPRERLVSLSLGRTRITDASLARIARFPEVVFLNIGWRHLLGDDPDRPHALITDAGLAHLRALPKLQNLGLERVPITDAGLDHLSPLHELHSLSLAGTKITDAGLARLPGLYPNLQYLNLDGCAITDEGARHLARLPKLKSLSLGDTAVDDAALETLRALPELRRLYLRGTRITDAGLRTLAGMRSLQGVNVRETRATAKGVHDLRQTRRDMNNVAGP